jgi:hypothetical protein
MAGLDPATQDGVLGAVKLNHELHKKHEALCLSDRFNVFVKFVLFVVQSC